MRVFQPDNKLLRILASEIEEKKKPIRIVAQGQNTALDEATESAKAYWMMGWTWEEIDSILEDSGFSAKAIASAIKAAQKYAYECLKDGPFKTLKEGQLVKLKSGLVGKLVNKYAEHISVVYKEDKIEVDSDNVDFEISAKLQKAHTLRESAKKIIKKAQGDKIEVPGEGEYPTELRKEPVIRETAPRTKTTPQMQTPKGLSPYMPEKFLDVPEATVTVQEYAETLATLQEMINETEGERKEVYNAYKEKYLAPKKELEKEQQEIGQKLAAILESQRQAAGVLETVFVSRTKDLLVGLVSTLGDIEEKPAGFVDQYNVLVKFLEDNFPEAAEQSLDMIEKWKEANKVMWRTLTTEISVSKPPEEMVTSKRAQGWWTKMKNWVSDTWNSIKQSIDTFYSTTVPKVEEINNALEDFLSDSQLQEQTAAINESLKVYLK